MSARRRSPRRRAVAGDPADWLPAAVITSGVALAVVPFAAPLSTGALAGLWIASMVTRSIAPVHQHCHAHYRIFGAAPLNVVYDLVLMLAAGNTTAVWELQHVVGHHHGYLTPGADPAANDRFGRPGPWQRVVFTIAGDAMSIADAFRLSRQRPKLRARLWRQLAVQAAATAALVVWDPALAVAFAFVPQLLLRWVVFWFSYAQHHDVPLRDVYSGSVTHFGWTNRWFLNVGHHTAHHEKPTLHWSRLPARTALILERIPSRCLR